MTANTRGGTLLRALEICLRPDETLLAEVDAVFTDDISVWSPNLLTNGIKDLVETLGVREEAFADLDIDVGVLDVFGDRGLIEFSVSATFTGPFVMDEDTVIEPNGHHLMLGAAVVADFDGERIKAMRAYFDDATLIEQMLAS